MAAGIGGWAPCGNCRAEFVALERLVPTCKAAALAMAALAARVAADTALSCMSASGRAVSFRGMAPALNAAWSWESIVVSETIAGLLP